MEEGERKTNSRTDRHVDRKGKRGERKTDKACRQKRKEGREEDRQGM